MVKAKEVVVDKKLEDKILKAISINESNDELEEAILKVLDDDLMEELKNFKDNSVTAPSELEPRIPKRFEDTLGEAAARRFHESKDQMDFKLKHLEDSLQHPDPVEKLHMMNEMLKRTSNLAEDDLQSSDPTNL